MATHNGGQLVPPRPCSSSQRDSLRRAFVRETKWSERIGAGLPMRSAIALCIWGASRGNDSSSFTINEAS